MGGQGGNINENKKGGRRGEERVEILLGVKVGKTRYDVKGRSSSVGRTLHKAEDGGEAAA